MGTGIGGGNSPCPCGSGRKYKLCCLRAGSEASSPTPTGALEAAATPAAGRFRFQAGSYGVPGGGFLTSIACLRREPDGSWAYHFVLVVPDSPLQAEEVASLEAGHHLLQAFQGSPASEAVAEKLKGYGYVSVSGFEVANRGSWRNVFRPAPGCALEHGELGAER